MSANVVYLIEKGQAIADGMPIDGNGGGNVGGSFGADGLDAQGSFWIIGSNAGGDDVRVMEIIAELA